MKADIEKIEALVSQVAQEEMVEVFDLAVLREGPRTVIRVFLDREGGIRLGECEAFSRKMSAALDVSDPMPGAASRFPRRGSTEAYEAAHSRRPREADRVALAEPVDGSRNYGTSPADAEGIDLGQDGRSTVPAPGGAQGEPGNFPGRTLRKGKEEAMILDIGQIITQLGKEKGIDRKVIVDAIKEALEIAARKKYGMNKRLEATYDGETGEFEILEFRTVVEKVADPEAEISLEAAREYDPEAAYEDNIGFRMSTRDLGRIAAQTARQIIMQKVKDAEREVIYNEFIGRKGEIISGIVQRYERDCWSSTWARRRRSCPCRSRSPNAIARRPDPRLHQDVAKTRGAGNPPFAPDPRVILKLFEQEVPEVTRSCPS
jgi:hypothetical protein